MAHVETLCILLSVVHNPNGGYVVDYLPSLGVEQVAPAIITPVSAKKKKKHNTKGLVAACLLEIHLPVSAFPECLFHDAYP